MANPLTDRVPPAQLACGGQVIDTQGVLSEFCRLREVVEADLASLAASAKPEKWRHAPIDIRLVFGWADAHRQIPVLEGQVSASIDAVCQRCLEPFELSLNAQLKLMLLEPGRKAAAFAEFEIWETTENTVRPLDIVDEALIMAMPLVPAHEDSTLCGPLAKGWGAREMERARPFADLKRQMREKK